MKIAVLADVHANLPALNEVMAHLDAWKPDVVCMAGDLVNRGPRPAECLALVLERQKSDGWLLVRGNHEDYVISHSLPDAPQSKFELEVHRGSQWTYRQLKGDMSALLAMPFQQQINGIDGGEVRVVHASMRGNRDGIYPDTTDKTLRKQLGKQPALLCVGHTHRSLVRWLDGTLVVNAGSTGLPFDGDNRAAYAQITHGIHGWNAEIVRVPYDIALAERDFFDTGFIVDAGPLAELVLVELRQARSQLFQWAALYQENALAGKINMRQAVDLFLQQEL